MSGFFANIWYLIGILLVPTLVTTPIVAFVEPFNFQRHTLSPEDLKNGSCSFKPPPPHRE
jgi:hypothetical protein